MKATTSGMTIGIALEGFDGSNALSEGVIRAEPREEVIVGNKTVQKKILKDNRYYGGEASADHPQGGTEEITVNETVQETTTTPHSIAHQPALQDVTKTGMATR